MMMLTKFSTISDLPLPCTGSAVGASTGLADTWPKAIA
jgi:hypothetical protein